MRPDDALALIAGGVPAGPATWADLGAGGGTFTRAVARRLGPGGRVVAVDRDPAAVAALTRLSLTPFDGAAIVPAVGDFADATAWAALPLPALDGALLANALHFVPPGEQGAVLARVAAALRPGGRLVLVEYADRAPSRWVPFPLPPARLDAIRPAALGPWREVGRRPSAYGGAIYAAVARTP